MNGIYHVLDSLIRPGNMVTPTFMEFAFQLGKGWRKQTLNDNTNDFIITVVMCCKKCTMLQ